MEDLIKPHFPNMKESKATLLSKVLGKTSAFCFLFLLLGHKIARDSCVVSVTVGGGGGSDQS